MPTGHEYLGSGKESGRGGEKTKKSDQISSETTKETGVPEWAITECASFQNLSRHHKS